MQTKPLKTQVKGKGKNQNTVSSKEAGLLSLCSWLRRKPASFGKKCWRKQRKEWVCVEWSHVGWPSLFSREVEPQTSDHRKKAGTWGHKQEREGSRQAVRCPWDRFSYLLFPQYMLCSIGTPQLARGAGAPRPRAQHFEYFLSSPGPLITASGSQKSPHLSFLRLHLREARYNFTSEDAHSCIFTLLWPSHKL